MELLRKVSQVVLGAMLVSAGVSHLGSSRAEFQAQVPSLLKEYADFVVVASGVAEIALGVALVFLWRFRAQVGLITAIFFTAVFWGNISQYLNHVDAFGLTSDRARAIRLLFQPILVVWAIWSTGAWVYVKQLRRPKLL